MITVTARRRALLRGGAVLQQRDAADLATPLFPPRSPNDGPPPCTWPDRFRYEPIANDREALRRVVAEADIITTCGRSWLLVSLPEPLLEYLATFEAEQEDFEDSDDAEPRDYAP